MSLHMDKACFATVAWAYFSARLKGRGDIRGHKMSETLCTKDIMYDLLSLDIYRVSVDSRSLSLYQYASLLGRCHLLKYPFTSGRPVGEVFLPGQHSIFAILKQHQFNFFPYLLTPMEPDNINCRFLSFRERL